MESRQKQLSDLKSYLQTVDTEVTIILQSLQWNRKGLLEGTPKVTCQYDTNHKVPSETLPAHEDNCRLRKLGYSVKDMILPDPLNENAVSFVKFSMTDIQHIINSAAQNDPLFKRGPGCVDPKPLTLERLQAAYTADERRAIYDAVVRAAPSCSDLSELALPSTNEGNQNGAGGKSRLEILAELRDMKRRRTKYRVAAKTQKYSDVLRDVIKTQMEVYSEVKAEEASITHVSSKRLSYTKDSNSPHISGLKRDSKEIKLEDSHTREKHKKYRTDRSRERCEDTRSNSENRRRHDYEDKYRDNKGRERRYKTEKDRYYDVDRDRRKSSHEKKYDRSHSRHGQTSSRDRSEDRSKDRSRDQWSHRSRENKTKCVKEEDGGHKYREIRSEKEEKPKRYYDVRIKEEKI